MGGAEDRGRRAAAAEVLQRPRSSSDSALGQPPSAGRWGRAEAAEIEPLGAPRLEEGWWGRARQQRSSLSALRVLLLGGRGLVQAVETPSGSIAWAVLGGSGVDLTFRASDGAGGPYVG